MKKLLHRGSIFPIVGIVLLCIGVSGCSSSGPAVDDEIDFAKEKPAEERASEDTGANQLEIKFPDVGLDPTQIYATNEEIRAAGFVFSDFKLLSISERLPAGIAKDSVKILPLLSTDEEGALQYGYQYVFGEISIQNETAEKKIYAFSSGFIVADSKLHPTGWSGELSYNSENSDPRAKDFACVELLPSAKKRIIFAHIMDPGAISQGDLYFSVYELGGFSETMKYIPCIVYKAR